MAAFGFANDATKILPAGINTYYIQSAKSGQVGHVSLEPFSDAKITISTLSAKGKRKRSHPYAVKIESSVRILGTTKATCLQKLDKLTDYAANALITPINGNAFYAQMGTEWEFVSEGGVDANRYIDFKQSVAGIITALDTVLLSGVTYIAADAADYLYGFAPGTVQPAGFLTLAIRNAGETNWESLYNWRNCSLRAKTVSEFDDSGRAIKAIGVDVTVAFDMLQSGSELELLDSCAAAQTDFKLTGQDGTVFSFADYMGFDFVIHEDEDLTRSEYVKVTGTASMTPAEFVACIS